jgi:LysM repeat protein
MDGPSRIRINHEVSEMIEKRSTKILHILVSVLVIAAFFAAVLPKPALAATCEETYTVKAGDTIGQVAKKYETTINKIARANDLERPYVLTAGQKLCIPKVPAPSSNYTWTAVYDGKALTLEGEKFKKTHPFIVKARIDPTDAWTKLGRVGSDKNGDLEKKYTLPKGLQGETFLTVCLKDGVTDFLDCKRVVRQ